MSMYISEMIDWLKNKAGQLQAGSLYVSQSVSTGSVGVYVSGSNPGGVRFNIVSTGSMPGARPSIAALNTMFPDATTGSLMIVGGASESWLVFKDIKGAWRSVTASLST